MTTGGREATQLDRYRLQLIAITAAAMAALMVGMRDDRGNHPSRVSLSADPLFAGRRLSGWIKLLESEDPDRRLGAARSLGDMGADAKGAVPALIRRLADHDSFVRTAAAHSLGQIGPEAAGAIPAMAAAFRRSSGFDKGIIGPALARIGPRAVPAIVELTRSSDEFVRWEATRALRLIGAGAGRAEDRLLELLSDPKVSTRVEAAHTLWKIRPRGSALDLLARALGDPEEFARAEAADALAEIGPEAAPALPDLIHALGDESASVRGRAAAALGKIGPRAKVAVPALLRFASRPGDGPSNIEVVKGIGPAAVPELTAGLDDPTTRFAAAWGLGKLGAEAEGAAPRLRVLMKVTGGKERTAFAASLWRIGRDPAVVPVLIDQIREDDFLVQAGAFEVLEEIGPEAQAAIPLLIGMLEHKNQFLRQHSAKALGRIGPAAKVTIPALEKALGDPENSNRIEVAAALWRVAHAEAAVVALSAEARRIGDSASTFAVIALGEIGQEAEAGVPALIEALGVESIFGKAIASQALGRIGPKAKAAIPRLIEIHNDIHNTERESFAQAIKAIEPEAALREGVR